MYRTHSAHVVEVVSLPMRDGNFILAPKPLSSSRVVSLPMRDGNVYTMPMTGASVSRC